MVLPAPDLDDRRFQDLVDDAKRMVQQRCPEWTDHNVSDPGVTLIETVAFMVDQLLYRLNRVPDRLYISFLDLIGVTLHEPRAARADITFWLTAPQDVAVVVPEGTQAGTPRTSREEPVVFATTRELVVPVVRLTHVGRQAHDGTDIVVTSPGNEALPAFSDVPHVGDCLMFGLAEAAPGTTVALRITCDVQGVGVDPLHPPIVWEAWEQTGWSACDVETDHTGGLNQPGDVVLHLPAGHVTSVLGRQRAGWIRCRVVEPRRARAYTTTPMIHAASAFSVGGTVDALHAQTVRDELLGHGEGVPSQSLRLAVAPVLPEEFVLEVSTGDGWEPWREVANFADCAADDRVFVLDRSTGEVRFAPAVREADGSLRHYGAAPAKGARIRAPFYRVGGGPVGNVAARTISQLRSSVPLVGRVENRRPATGGVAAETVDEAKVRGPLALRSRERAVTAEDYEQLALAGATDVARTRCVAASGGTRETPDEDGTVRLLVVPAARHEADGRLKFESLVPSDDLLQRVTDHLDRHRMVGVRLVVEPPVYQGVTVVARLVAKPRTKTDLLHDAALVALNRYLDPLIGGPDGAGWPFGRPVQAGEIYAVLQQLAGTEIVDDVLLFAADPRTGRRGDPVQRIDIDRHALVFGYEHQVRVSASS